MAGCNCQQIGSCNALVRMEIAHLRTISSCSLVSSESWLFSLCGACIYSDAELGVTVIGAIQAVLLPVLRHLRGDCDYVGKHDESCPEHHLRVSRCPDALTASRFIEALSCSSTKPGYILLMAGACVPIATLYWYSRSTMLPLAADPRGLFRRLEHLKRTGIIGIHHCYWIMRFCAAKTSCRPSDCQYGDKPSRCQHLSNAKSADECSTGFRELYKVIAVSLCS